MLQTRDFITELIANPKNDTQNRRERKMAVTKSILNKRLVISEKKKPRNPSSEFENDNWFDLFIFDIFFIKLMAKTYQK